MSNNLVINYGHALTEQAQADILNYGWDNIVTCQLHIEPIDSAYSYCLETMHRLEYDYQLSTRKNLMILLPGLSIASAYLTAMLTGLLGRMPYVCHMTYNHALGAYHPVAVVDLSKAKSDGWQMRHIPQPTPQAPPREIILDGYTMRSMSTTMAASYVQETFKKAKHANPSK